MLAHTHRVPAHTVHTAYSAHTVLAHTHTHTYGVCATLANEAKKVWPALYYTAVSRDDDDMVIIVMILVMLFYYSL